MGTRGGALAALVLASLAGCGGDGTFLSDDVLTSMHATDVALRSGDVDNGCDVLQQTAHAINDWTADARGNLAPVANQIAERIEGITMSCRDRDLAETQAEWQRESKRLRDAARIDSGWGRIFWWTLAFVGSMVVGLFIRRRLLG